MWVDICCIDKSFFVEFIKLINFMYDYYVKVKVCFVYFCDLEFVGDDLGKVFFKCRWFIRGWIF